MSDVNDDRMTGYDGILSPSNHRRPILGPMRRLLRLLASIWTPCRSGGWLGARAPEGCHDDHHCPATDRGAQSNPFGYLAAYGSNPLPPPATLRHPLIAPAGRRWGCPDFGKLIEVPILSIVHSSDANFDNSLKLKSIRRY